MSKKVTIYMPVFNGENYIECAIRSILSQSYQNYTLLISDNHSTDNTVEIVKKYLHDDRITLVVKSQNVGMINNGNDCLRMIRTPYFMGLCHDDYFYDDRALEIGVDILESMPEIPVVYCDMMFVDSHNKEITRKRTGYSGKVDSNTIARKSITHGRNLFSIPLLVRTSAITGFEYSDNFYHTSDIDFSIFIGNRKHVYYLQESLFALRFHGTNNTARKFDTVDDEFLRLAGKYQYKISKLDRLMMKFNHYANYTKKSLFYFYLDKIRG